MATKVCDGSGSDLAVAVVTTFLGSSSHTMTEHDIDYLKEGSALFRDIKSTYHR